MTDTMNSECLYSPPTPTAEAGQQALSFLLRERNVMGTLQIFHQALGDIFRLNLPGFNPIMMAGPDANRFVLVEAREKLSWRPTGDPVTKLLRHGLLIEDGEWHDQLRQQMTPALHKKEVAGQVPAMLRRADQVIDGWQAGGRYDMLDEMRRVALLILMDTLYGVDFTDALPQLWPTILKLLKYISPGPWLIWRGAPRPGYKDAIEAMDAYLYELIQQRRQNPRDAVDLLGLLTDVEWMGDGLIRDQLLTMLIAGHDTGTALMAWTLYLLGSHPAALHQAQEEVDRIIGSNRPSYEQLERLEYLDQVIKESLRLYPPIHVGTRRASCELAYKNYCLPEGDRILYSIYLTHRDPQQWADPNSFRPERFIVERGRRTYEPYSYVPFGGGPRNCIGAYYGQMEAKVVLARMLQRCRLTLTDDNVHMHMGATLEPRPGVMMKVALR